MCKLSTHIYFIDQCHYVNFYTQRGINIYIGSLTHTNMCFETLMLYIIHGFGCEFLLIIIFSACLCMCVCLYAYLCVYMCICVRVYVNESTCRWRPEGNLRYHLQKRCPCIFDRVSYRVGTLQVDWKRLTNKF